MLNPFDSKLIGQYLSFPEEEACARIIAVGKTHLTAFFNFAEVDHWREHLRLSPKDGRNAPEYIIRHIELEKLDENLVYKEPQYRNISLAFSTGSGTIQSVPGKSTSQLISEQISQGEFNMAKTAVFDSENELIEVYKSGKDAKAAHKGQTDVKYVTEDKFEPIGQYQNKEDLFPPVEKPAKEPKAPKEDGEKATRTIIKRAGAYTVVKADGARFEPSDERAALHAAMVESETVEEYLEKAPKLAKFVSSRGAEQSVTATGYLSYGFKRGWIKQGDVAAEPEVEVQEAGDND